MDRGPRRIVTGEDAAGCSRVTASELPRRLDLPGHSEVEMTHLWTASTATALDVSGTEPPAIGVEQLYPGPGETRFLRIVYPPGFGAADPDAPGSPSDRLLVHRTTTVDFGVVVSGEVTLVLDDGSETTLRPGDSVVQNGVSHGWRNVGSGPAVVHFVMVGMPA